MFRGALFSFCLPLFACNPGTVADEGAAEIEPPLPLHTHDLQVSPSCYVESSTIMSSGSGANATGLVGSTGTDFSEMNASFNLQYMMLFNRLIQDDPTAEHWQLDQRFPDGTGFDVRIEATHRGEHTSHFELTFNSTRRIQTSPMGESHLIETNSVAFGTSNARATTVDYGSMVFRWSDHAREIRMVRPVPVTDGGVLRWEQRVVSELRGCDPGTLVSFSNSYDGGEIECWSMYGFPTDCTHVNLWP